MVRASASQSVDLGFNSQIESYKKTLKNGIHSFLACLVLSTIGIVWRTSRQACSLCPWARHLTGCLYLYVADRWWGQAVYSLCWANLTEDSQIEPERTRSVCTSFRIMLFSNSSNDEEETAALEVWDRAAFPKLWYTYHLWYAKDLQVVRLTFRN